MDSWTLQGDSYSFLRSAPRTFSLRHRDGTPNHVEIFDITNIPSHRSAISETTCLCDIFGDDCEPPSLSSSSASGSCVPSQREVDRRAATSPLVDDSSGSYHTAQGSSEGEDGFEDSTERLHSPTSQKEHSERQSEGLELSSGHPGLSKDVNPKLEPESTSPLPQLSTGSPSSEVLNSTCSDRTPSAGNNSPQSLSLEGRVSSSSSSSIDTRRSLSSPNSRQTHLAAESQSITPTSRDRHNSSSRQSTQSPSPEPSNRTNSSSSESVNTLSLPDSGEAHLSPEPRNISDYCENSPSPEPTSISSHSLGSSPSTFEPRDILSSHSPSLCETETSSKSRETSVSPELKNRSYSPDTQASSPFPELRGRVSLPDLFSRGSTPDIEGSPYTPELIPYSPSAGRDTTTTPENRDSSLSAEPGSTLSTPAPRYTPPPSVTSLAITPEGSGPHTCGICYSVVQPEDLDTTPFPELSRLSTPESGRTYLSPELRNPTPRRGSTQSSTAESTVSPSSKSPNNSPAHKATANSPVQKAEDPQPKFAAYSPTPDDREINSCLKPSCIPESSGRQPSPKVGARERLAKDMAHHVNRKRTPSPPLTRFTPVHIIAPEKPYRQWQNRTHSPQQVTASHTALTGNLKKPLTNRESPNVAPSDSNSQAHWLRQERELEIEREMQWEEERERERELERQRQRDMEREMERGRSRTREELAQKKGEGRQGDASYRGEQVELSFSARNRKGPASHSTAPTSRETHQGMPTARSYSESSPAARKLQQQQSLLRAQTSQQSARAGGSSRRLQPAVPQGKSTASGRVAAKRPSQSSSSSMGSELDEADNEVKWFTDLAFRSLSSPEVDYLDMYNSSHRSSTNISQPSTQESPAGANAAWLAYADFRGSAPRLDNEDLSFQQPSTYYSDGLDPSKRFELGSFECVDVAVEREDSRRVRRGVPKRQIQLKRKDTAEGKQDESSENSSPLVPGMVDSPSLQRRAKETLVRQHSTPAAMQESYHTEPSPEPVEKNERKFKLQKAASLDETCTKTKMATCLIKSVLSKKMQSVDKQTEEQEREDSSPPSEEKSPPPESVEAPLKKSPQTDTHNLGSSLHSDHRLSPEDLVVAREPTKKGDVRPQQNFGVKPSNSPSPNSSHASFTLQQTDSDRAYSQSRNTSSRISEMRSELMVPFDRKQSTERKTPKNKGKQADGSERWEEREGSDSANATARNTGAPLAPGASSSTQANRDQESEILGTEDDQQLLQSDKSTYMLKTPEITLKASPATEKKKTSLNVSLTPEVENKPDQRREVPSPETSLREQEGGVEAKLEEKTEEEEGKGNNKVKVPIHKVRDVRRLVKNTYNLSFKATSAVMPSPGNEGRGENKKEANKERTEEMTQEGKEEVREEKREAGQEARREDVAEESKGEETRGEERKVDAIDAKLLTLSPSAQRGGMPLSRSQPMQIECKAVRWKEDKNKMTRSKTEPEKPGDGHRASPRPIAETGEELGNSPYASTWSPATGDAATAKPCRPDAKAEAEAQNIQTKTLKTPDNEDKPEVIRKDKKPPMLGSLPKLPSKEREVSTAVVVIRDGSSKTKTSESQASDEILTPLQVPSTSPSPGPNSGASPGSSGHSVSMLLKEKGYQADIGAVVGEGQSTAGGKGISHKHVNRLEIPLQTCTPPSEGGLTESRRERTFSSSSIKSGPTTPSDNTETLTKNREEEGVSTKPTVRDTAKQNCVSPLRNTQQQTPSQIKQKEQGDFETMKRQDPTFPPRSPALRRFRPQPIEVKSLSKETQKQEMPTSNLPTNRSQTIEVKSIANNSQKPVVPPKPNYKFNPTDLGPLPNQTQKSAETTSRVKTQGEERSQTIVVSSPTIYRKLSSETTPASNYTRKLAVSAVSSYRPPQSKTTTTTISSLPNRSAAATETEASNERAQQQQPLASPQSSRYTQRPTTLATDPKSATGPGLTSAPGPGPSLAANQVPGPASAVASPSSKSAVMDLNSQPQYPRTTYPQEQAMPMTSNNAKQPAAVSTTQAPRYTQANQSYHRALSNERSQRTEDLHFYASDDPPSYDERESFSPLMLPDLTPRKPSCYPTTTRPPPCPCTSGCPSHPGLTPPHHHHSPRNLTPPAPSHSPGQALPYPVGQPHLRPHQCRPDPQPMSYQPSSPKSSPLGPSQPPTMYQPLHQPPSYPPHATLMQSCPADRPLQPQQHMDPRRPPVHRSPQQQPPGVGGGPYSVHSHSHSPGLPPLDPQYLCGPQSLGPSYGSEYGGDSSSLYSESSYGQTPRRVLMDPETGKYFYIEVPVQPLRKMLFDPETGQYVEVLIPQQAMSHSGLYPPSAAPYPSLHNPNMYAPAPQYMPYAAPPPPPHPQAQPQPPRHPEASASATMHQNGAGVGYGSPSGQGSKLEPQSHPPLDQNYLEGMYYVPTGMNASPNPTSSDCFHKHPPTLPNAGGKRS
ncbi:uncharacterized protein ACJ7VT_006180 [Polymixia lowei]